MPPLPWATIALAGLAKERGPSSVRRTRLTSGFRSIWPSPPASRSATVMPLVASSVTVPLVIASMAATETVSSPPTTDPGPLAMVMVAGSRKTLPAVPRGAATEASPS